MSLDAIKAAIPHREPFLLLDEIVEQSDDRIVCRKRFIGDEFWYAGHYPEFPITPGVLLCEAAMQAGAVLLSKKVPGTVSKEVVEKVPGTFIPVATRMNNVKFKSMVRPGDTVDFTVDFVEQVSGAFFLTAKITVGDRLAATFDFACKMAATS